MTVCLAAICHHETDGIMCIGAADRMVTTGSIIESQPSSTKIWPLTTSIVALVAGDLSLQAEIFHGYVFEEIQNRILAPNADWLKVNDVAELYCQSYWIIRKKRAENEVLNKYGLTYETLISKQDIMKTEFIEMIGQELKDFSMPGVSVIFAGNERIGKDGVKPRLYSVNDGQINCHDAIGYIATGSGAYHASSSMIFSGHTSMTRFEEAFLNVFMAKKRAELAPGVGSETDMFLIGGQLGPASRIWV